MPNMTPPDPKSLIALKGLLARQGRSANIMMSPRLAYDLLALAEQGAEARRAAIEECACWHDQRRRDTPDAFEMEFHEVSAAALRSLTTSTEKEEG